MLRISFRDLRESAGQASMTIANPESTAALSAAPLDGHGVFPGDSDCFSVPTGSTLLRCLGLRHQDGMSENGIRSNSWIRMPTKVGFFGYLN
jgi:hypothetical protein